MSLHIGMDEAGYGPRLGPMVVGAVGFEAPMRPGWKDLAPFVTRVGGGGEILVDDSKRVYGGSGFKRLEACVGPFLCAFGFRARTVHELVADLAGDEGLRGLVSLPWYREDRPLAAFDGSSLRGALRGARIEARFLRIRVLTADELNGLFSSGRNKLQAEWRATGCLIKRALSAGAREIVVDRMGGRKDYWALLSELLTPAVVWEKSRGSYEVEMNERRVRVSFRKRADESDFCTSLASMVCKYVRELLMERLNSFFAAHSPGLRSTAGYPRDAARFLRETKILRSHLGLLEESLVRRR